MYRALTASFSASSLTVVLGPNGSGKSTLLRDLAGLRRLAGGEIWLNDQVLASWSAADRARRIAYLPQRTTLEHDMPVSVVVLLGRAPYIGRFAAPGRGDHERVRAALERVGLTAEATRDVHSLSGGEFQRVMLARMLVSEAEVLVLDEPTAALDIGHALSFLALCRQLAASGATVVLAMHELELARRHADQAILLTGDGEGRAHVGAPAEVLTPATLEPVFAVRVRERDGQLRFDLPPASADEGSA